jgi:hypothetical protein
MKKTLLIAVFPMIMFVVLAVGLPFFKGKAVYAQQPDNDANLSKQQRLGTANIVDLPDEVNLLYGNHQNASLNQEFLLLGNNPGATTNRHDFAVANPDYGLSTPIPTLKAGENFIINSTTDADIIYSSVAVLLVQITSPFPPADTSIEDIDPESDLSLSAPIILGAYKGTSGTFVMPQTASPGYYLLYAYLQYPTYNVTAVYNVAVQVTSGNGGSVS